MAEADGCFAVVKQCADRLVALGAELPTWDALVAGATPDHVHATPVEEPCVHRSWQQHVSNTVEKVFQTEALWPSLDMNERALALSQSGPLAGVPFHCLPTSHATRLDSEIFRTLLLRRLRLPLPLNARVCRCGRLLDCLGHHRSACAVSGALGRRGFEVEVAVARICARRWSKGFQPMSWYETWTCSQVLRRGGQTVRSRRRRVDPVPRRPTRD